MQDSYISKQRHRQTLKNDDFRLSRRTYVTRLIPSKVKEKQNRIRLTGDLNSSICQVEERPRPPHVVPTKKLVNPADSIAVYRTVYKCD